MNDQFMQYMVKNIPNVHKKCLKEVRTGTYNKDSRCEESQQNHFTF